MFQVGDNLKIECYKHNGDLDRTSDEATILEIGKDYIIVANDHAKLIEKDGKSHRTNEPAVLFFYKKKWFNIIGQLKKNGLFYYCNLASPYLIEDDSIKYIDYDLDLRVFPDGGFKILDRNEYRYHKKLMHYPKDIDTIIKEELSALILQKRENKGPFAPEVIENYYQKYQEIRNNKKI